ncbi:MAG: carbohydrate ABC transporter permease [Oscillospiraceae bacterium]|nr:carbohydrate ABC transporter permease [Oscillospiraceae bacterium]
MAEKTAVARIVKMFIYLLLIILAAMSIFPFFIMLVNATRSTPQIQQQAVSLIPSSFLLNNMRLLSDRGAFDALLGFRNSIIIAGGTTVLSLYFSSLTAYALTAYKWRLRQGFFTFIMAVMMIPGLVGAIGYARLVWQFELTNNFLPLILPAVAAPTIVFFMRQYLIATLSIDIVNSGRVDGANEFRIFNQIVLPMMKPAVATQAIFIFVASWNTLFLPRLLLINTDMFTMPLMVGLLNADIYRTEFGAIYLALSLSILPLFVLYFALSRYIIAGVQLGGVKE